MICGCQKQTLDKGRGLVIRSNGGLCHKPKGGAQVPTPTRFPAPDNGTCGVHLPPPPCTLVTTEHHINMY